MQPNVSGHPLPEIGLYVLGALPHHEEEELEAHLAVCPDCIGEASELGLIIDLLQSSITAEDLVKLTAGDVIETCPKRPHVSRTKHLYATRNQRDRTSCSARTAL